MRKIICLVLLGVGLSVSAQSTFYSSDHLPEIKLYFTQSNWSHILDSLYVDGQEERLLASVEIDGTMYDSIGVRYKGFSSVSVGRKKNPFNIKLDYVKSHEHEGIDKIKLSNVIQDPSFLREVLSYEVARKYMPASECNFAKVYINDVYWGLYSNVEAVNKGFMRKHFGSSTTPYFKCNPVSLDLNGENANLSQTPGTDTTSYYPFYELKSDAGWREFYHLIDTLNNHASEVEHVLNIDQTLWMHAFNYAVINFDSYVGYAQNYYLYQDLNGHFHPIIWDLNQSFASYRLTDASNHYQGFTIAQAKVMDPLLHLNSVSVYPRPLMRNLFTNDTYKRMYLAHLRTIMDENFANGSYKTRMAFYQNLIDGSVQSDTNKFYSYQDFIDNQNSTVSDVVAYPGLTDLMDARSTYLSAYEGFLGYPTIEDPEAAFIGTSVQVDVEIENAIRTWIYYRTSKFDAFSYAPLANTSGNNYTYTVSGVDQVLEYYIYAENDSSGGFSPARAAHEYWKLEPPKDLVINEVLASNDQVLADESGDFDDWIELYNNTDSDISLNGLYLSDDAAELDQFALPDTAILANSFILIWADKDSALGIHANFKLSAGGEGVFLSDSNGVILDQVTFGSQTTDISYGRFPNGTGNFGNMVPTPDSTNVDYIITSVEELQHNFVVAPNPSNGLVKINTTFTDGFNFQVINLQGQRIANGSPTKEEIQLDLSAADRGLYFLILTKNAKVYTQKIILQ